MLNARPFYLENRLGRGRKLETSSITGGGGGALEAERVGPGRVRVVPHQPGIHHEDVARREACFFHEENRREKQQQKNSRIKKKAGLFVFLSFVQWRIVKREFFGEVTNEISARSRCVEAFL